MDGHVVARAVRGLSTAPLLFLTARSEQDDILAGIASGAADYLTKPFHPKELREAALRLCPVTNVSGDDTSQDPATFQPL